MGVAEAPRLGEIVPRPEEDGSPIPAPALQSHTPPGQGSVPIAPHPVAAPVRVGTGVGGRTCESGADGAGDGRSVPPGLPRDKASMAVISWSLSWMSNTSALATIRSRRADFGITATAC